MWRKIARSALTGRSMAPVSPAGPKSWHMPQSRGFSLLEQSPESPARAYFHTIHPLDEKICEQAAGNGSEEVDKSGRVTTVEFFHLDAV